MNTTLTIPPKIEATQPKPSKAQLVEALLTRARLAHEKEQEIIQAKRDELEAQIEAEARKAVFKNHTEGGKCSNLRALQQAACGFPH